MTVPSDEPGKNRRDEIKERQAEILKLSRAGMGLTEISRKLGVSRGSVYGVINKYKVREIQT